MSVSPIHILRQGEVIAAILRAVAPRLGPPAPVPQTPSPERNATVAPRNPSHVRDFIVAMGGDPAAYRGHLPPMMFPQWGMPLMAEIVGGLPYNALKVVNLGCRIEQKAALPEGEPLLLQARLDSLDVNERRVVVEQRITTGTMSAPEALIAHVQAFVPRGDKSRAPKGRKRPKEQPTIPPHARAVDDWHIAARAGLEFTILTGDLNPIHLFAPWARMMGFKRAIYQGFASAARAFETLARVLGEGDPARIASFQARFTKPLLMPNDVRVFVDAAGGVFVGHTPGGPAYMVGGFALAE